MSTITGTEIDTFVNTAQEALSQFREAYLRHEVRALVGKTLMIERLLKDPVSGDKGRHVLEATIVGAQWTYEDGIDFKVTYVHPFTGASVETDEGA